jgi:hypothetical protein
MYLHLGIIPKSENNDLIKTLNLIKIIMDKNIRELTILICDKDNYKQFNLYSLASQLNNILNENIKVNVCGNLKYVPNTTREHLCYIVDKTKNNYKQILNLAICYDRHSDMIRPLSQPSTQKCPKSLRSLTLVKQGSLTKIDTPESDKFERECSWSNDKCIYSDTDSEDDISINLMIKDMYIKTPIDVVINCNDKMDTTEFFPIQTEKSRWTFENWDNIENVITTLI